MTNVLNRPGPAIVAALALSLATLLAATSARSQSFSCSQASQPSEMAVCNSEDLLVLDEKLAAMAAQRLSATTNKPARQAFSREQQAWLSLRNACGSDPTCLELRYSERMLELAGTRPVAGFVRFADREKKG